MRKRLLLIGTLLLPALAAAAQPSAATAELDRFEAFLDGVMSAQFRDYELAGMTFALVLDRRLAFSKGYGYADLASRTPVDPARHLFRPGSVGKLFTWTAVMQLVESGALSLDAPVQQYVSQLEIPEAFGVPLTLTHIMTHTPGFEDGAAGFLFADEAAELVPLAESLAAHVPAQVREPGTFASYSNFATALAGLAVANVSGLTFEDYVDQHIFQPLGMQRSTFDEPLPEALAVDFATGYASKHGGIEPMGFEFIKNFGPAGALSAPAEDMARFIIAHVSDGELEGARILEADTVARMHSRLFAHDPRVAGMAHGFYEIRRNGERFVGHDGDTIAFHSALVIKPEDGFGFFLSFNAPEGGRARPGVTDSVLDYFYPGDGGAAPAFPEQPLPGAAERAEAVAGAYRVNRRSYTGLEGVVGLAGDVMFVAGPEGEVIRADGDGGRLIEVEPYVYRLQGRQELLVFDADDIGRVQRAFIGSFPVMIIDRMPFLEQARIHQLVIALALLAALFVLLNAARRGPRRDLSGSAQLARRLQLGASVAFLAFALGMMLVLGAADMSRMVFDFPPPGTALVLILPLLGLLCTIGTAVLLVPVWRGEACRLWEKLRYTYVTLVFILLLGVLGYWNLLGWNY